MNELATRAGMFLALLDLELEVEALRLTVESGDSRQIQEAINRLILMVAANKYNWLEQLDPYLLTRIARRLLEANCILVSSRISLN